MPLVVVMLAGVAVLAVVLALFVWPQEAETAIVHTHEDLAPDHPHLRGAGGPVHAHPIVIDELHPAWP